MRYTCKANITFEFKDDSAKMIINCQSSRGSVLTSRFYLLAEESKKADINFIGMGPCITFEDADDPMTMLVVCKPTTKSGKNSLVELKDRKLPSWIFNRKNPKDEANDQE